MGQSTSWVVLGLARAGFSMTRSDSLLNFGSARLEPISFVHHLVRLDPRLIHSRYTCLQIGLEGHINPLNIPPVIKMWFFWILIYSMSWRLLKDKNYPDQIWKIAIMEISAVFVLFFKRIISLVIARRNETYDHFL